MKMSPRLCRPRRLYISPIWKSRPCLQARIGALARYGRLDSKAKETSFAFLCIGIYSKLLTAIPVLRG